MKFSGKNLKIADLTGASLKILGGHADLSGTTDYDTAQVWSKAVFDNPAKVDGFAYMSRHINNEMAVVLFDRAQPKLTVASVQALTSEKDFGAVASLLNIVGV